MLDESKNNSVFEIILETVSVYFNVPKEHIMRFDRRKDVARARMVVAYIARERCGMSYPVIGKLLNGRDHSTVMHGHNKISKEIENNEQLQKDILILVNAFCDKSSNGLFNNEIKTIKIIQNIVPLRIKPKKLTLEQAIIKMQQLPDESYERMKYIIKLWDAGWSLGKIGNRMEITRERVRQIIEAGLKYEIKDLFLSGKKVIINEYIKKRKDEHGEAIGKIYQKKRNEKEVKQQYEKEKKEKLRKIRAKEWSRDYSKCGMCDTTKVPHRVWGYCENCFHRSPEHRESAKKAQLKRKDKVQEWRKEYYKRPEVVSRTKETHDRVAFGGNRRKTIERDGYKCLDCGLSLEESQEKYGCDLYVIHLKDKHDNVLSNLRTVCRGCFTRRNLHK